MTNTNCMATWNPANHAINAVSKKSRSVGAVFLLQVMLNVMSYET